MLDYLENLSRRRDMFSLRDKSGKMINKIDLLSILSVFGREDSIGWKIIRSLIASFQAALCNFGNFTLLPLCICSHFIL